MDHNSIRQALRAELFKPFDLCLADGRRLAVNHPDFVAMNQRIVIVTNEESATQNLQPLSIVSLEPRVGKGPNGSQKKRPKR